MTIVIPMAGLSSRFQKAGFTLPKYMLYAGNKSLFNLSVSSFSSFFDTASFLFIARDVFCTEEFIQKECLLMGIKNYKVIILNELTRGQAETVYKGIKEAKINTEDDLLIFNIDTIRRDFKMPEDYKDWDGFLEVFFGEGENWSYAKTDLTNKRVIETAEKRQISNYCSDGIYYFNSRRLFELAFEIQVSENQSKRSEEFYIAPLYNILIKLKKNVCISLVNNSELSFCGVPKEYYEYLHKLNYDKI